MHMNYFNTIEPYNALPLLPIDKDVESKAVLKQCIKSRSALAELKQIVKRLPNQTILINTLPLLEAQASSEIENIVTTTDKLFQYANTDAAPQSDVSTKEALRYSSALTKGYRNILNRPLCTLTATEICSEIKGVEMNVRNTSGTALANDKTGDIIYTPPFGEEILRGLLKNLENFLHEEDGLDPLIKMAIAHYQFEAIHPFTDGNGRTGRILNILFLIDKELLDIPVLYLSRYILQNKDDYYRLLQDVTRTQNWQDWLLYILRAVEETANGTSLKIDAILLLMNDTSDYIKTKMPKIYSHELVDLIFTQPYCRINNVVEQGIAKRQTASVYLHQLNNKDVLNDVQIGREKLFINPRFMHILLNDDNAYRPFDRL